MASVPHGDYLSYMAAIFGQAKAHLLPDAILAVLIAPMSIKQDYLDLPVEFVKIGEGMGLRLVRRISVPVSSQQVGPQVMEHCRDNRILVALLRDLLLFRAE